MAPTSNDRREQGSRGLAMASRLALLSGLGICILMGLNTAHVRSDGWLPVSQRSFVALSGRAQAFPIHVRDPFVHEGLMMSDSAVMPLVTTRLSI